MIFAAQPEPAILFVRRTERAADPWSGQMAFPGGYRAAADESLAGTAQRETYEETGLDLAATGEQLGALDDENPRSPFLPKIVVTPFVFLLAAQRDVAAGPEVEEAVWLRALDLFAPESRRPLTVRLPVGSRTFDSVLIGRYTIWGLTERILRQIERLAPL